MWRCLQEVRLCYDYLMMIANDRISFSLIDSQSYDKTGKSIDVVVTTPIRQSYDKTGKSIDVVVTTPISFPQA